MRIAIVGAGLMGRWHAYYARRAGAAVVAVVDANPDVASKLAGRRGNARTFASLDQALQHVRTDAVHICTPPPTHAALAETALNARQHVLIEKPLAEDFEQTQRLLELAAKHGRMLVPVHQFPFQRGFGSLLQHRRRLGDLVRVEFHTCSAGGEAHSPQRREQILREILPHPFSLMQRLVNRKLSQLTWQTIYAREDDLTLAASDGSTQLSIVISLRGRPTRNELCVAGTQATAHLDLFHGFCLWDEGSTGRMGKMLRPLRLGTGFVSRSSVNLARRTIQRQPAYPGLFELIVGFYHAIQYNASWPISADESLDIARCLTIWQGEQVSNLPQHQ